MSRDDEELLTTLRGLAERADPPPSELRAVARGAFAWRDAERELAELVYDSTTDDRALAGLRGDSEPWLLTFGSDITVEVEVLRTQSTRRLVGQVIPPQEARIEVRHSDGIADVRADEVGRFVADGIACGPVSMRCYVGDRVVDTEWVTL